MSDVPLIATKASKPRDRRLDFWRGLCLVDMVIVHMVWGGIAFGDLIKQFLGEYIRFAAGGFILVAGMTISAIYGPRLADAVSRAKSYRAIWNRSLFLLAVHIASVMTVKVVEVLWGAQLDYPLHETILRVVTLRYGSDLLLFYACVLFAAPFLLEMMRRWKWVGIALVIALSLTLFQLNSANPYFLWPINDGFQKPGNFPVMLWQVIFVTGMLLGRALPTYDRLRTRAKVWIATGITLFAMGIYLLAYAPEWNLPIQQSLISFKKIPLTAGEILRYLGVVGTLLAWTELAWPHLSKWRLSGLIADLGRRSLPVYICHLWLVSLACWACQMWLWMIGPFQGMILFVIMAILLGVVYGMDRVEARKARRKSAGATASRTRDRSVTVVGAPRPTLSSYLPNLAQLLPQLALPAGTVVASSLALLLLVNTIRKPQFEDTRPDSFSAVTQDPSPDQSNDIIFPAIEESRPPTSY